MPYCIPSFPHLNNARLTYFNNYLVPIGIRSSHSLLVVIQYDGRYIGQRWYWLVLTLIDGRAGTGTDMTEYTNAAINLNSTEAQAKVNTP